MPHLLGIAMMLSPSLIHNIQGDPTMFVDANVDSTDTVVHVINGISLLIVTLYTSIFLHEEAMKTLELHGKIASEICFLLDGHGNLGGEVLHLRTREAVTNFKALYLMEERIFLKQGAFQVAAFDPLSLLALVASVLIFLLVLLDREVEAWSFILFVSSTFFMVLSTSAFSYTISTHNKLYVGVRRGLKNQRRRCVNLIGDLEDRMAAKNGAGMEYGRVKEISAAIKHIDLLVDCIAETREPLRMHFGAYVMKYENLIKHAGLQAGLLFVSVVLLVLKEMS